MIVQHHPVSAATAWGLFAAWIIGGAFIGGGVMDGGVNTASGQEYTSGLKLLPDTAAGVVRVPDLPALCDAWDATTLSGLTDDPKLKPLIEANFGVGGTVWKSISDRVGVRPQDLYEIGTGEVVAAWLSYTNKRRPSAMVLISDIRGNEAAASKVIEQIDADLKAEGGSRRDIAHRGQTIRVYSPKTKAGQLKIEEVVVCLTAERLIAADFSDLVQEILDAIATGNRADSLSDAPLRNLVTDAAYERLRGDAAELADGWQNTVVEWFAKPLEVGRIVRDVAKVDRGSKVKIVDLLEKQGFDAIQAAGGVVVTGTESFDLLHRGHVHAPPIAGQADRYRLAARMLDFPNSPKSGLPAWIPDDVASVTRLNWNLEKAFWASETLVDEALGSVVFRPSIVGIRDDEVGPQIDIAKNVIPNLDDQLIILTDNTLPATIDSERLLVAIGIKDEQAITTALRKAMEAEPDVSKIETVPGVTIWKVQEGQGDGEDIGEIDFQDLGFEEDPDEEEKRLLNTFALATIPQGKCSDIAYLVFASHVDLLEKIARRIAMAEPPTPLSQSPEFNELVADLEQLGAEQTSIERLLRLRYSLRAKYELLRRGELKDSDSILATLVRRAFEDESIEEDIERPNQAKWPPFAEIEKYFRNAVSYVESTETGWTLNGFLLR